jgi:hypothetical protein
MKLDVSNVTDQKQIRLFCLCVIFSSLESINRIYKYVSTVVSEENPEFNLLCECLIMKRLIDESLPNLKKQLQINNFFDSDISIHEAKYTRFRELIYIAEDFEFIEILSTPLFASTNVSSAFSDSSFVSLCATPPSSVETSFEMVERPEFINLEIAIDNLNPQRDTVFGRNILSTKYWIDANLLNDTLNHKSFSIIDMSVFCRRENVFVIVVTIGYMIVKEQKY